MGAPEQPQLTVLLQAWSDGHQDALEKLAPRVYEELHRLAARYMAGERPDHELQRQFVVIHPAGLGCRS